MRIGSIGHAVFLTSTALLLGLAAATPARGQAPPVAPDALRIDAALDARLRAAVATPGPDGPLLPPGSVLAGVRWQAAVLEIDVELPAAADAFAPPMSDVEAIVDALADAVDRGRDYAGLRVRFRQGPDGPFRLLEEAARAAPAGVYADPLDLPLAVPPAAATGRSGAPESPAAAPQPSGALSGVVVYVNAGHGWTAGSSSWFLQRPLLLDMVEDYGNLDQLNYFVQYCYDAGATVVPFRPVGYQDHEIVLDQDDPGVTYTGGWIDSSSNPYYENGATVSGVSYRFATAVASETAAARYTPNLPETGSYPVYTWVLDSANRTTQKYRIVHSGGVSEVIVDHRMVGKGWVWLGNYHFAASDGGYVEISNESSAGGVVIADAIRFGNGIGDVVGAGPGSVSGYPRDQEAARYWAESEADGNAVGLPTSIYDCCSSDSSDNVGTAARWAREMNNTSINGDRFRRVYLEFHSNASSGGARGTVALITGNNTTNQALYAQIIADEIERDMLVLDAGFEHVWGQRSPTFSGSYGAISTTNNSNEFDATILEVAFHDNQEDAELLLDPKVRDAVARSSVHGLVRFLNALPGSTIPLAFAPAAPVRVQARHDGAGGIVLAWQPPPAGDAWGDAPDGYRVQRSADGYGFDGGGDVGNVLTTTLTDVPAGETTFLRVVAYNAGGQSPPSRVLAVRHDGGEPSTFLIVDGFDRIGRSQNPRQALAGLGTQRRPIIRHVNSGDYAVQQGHALAAAGARFDTCENEAVLDGTVLLDDYRAVVWITGEESSADSSFDPAEQALVEAYLDAGGRLFASGAEIGWDLDNLDNGRAFYNDYLKADYSLDDANTYTVAALPGSIFAGLPTFQFDNGTLYYDAEFPDVLNGSGGGVPALSYLGGTGGGAGVVYDGAFRVVNFGFPFETITSSSGRALVMDRIVGFFFDGLFDADRDGDVDAADLASLAGCLAGPDNAFAPGDVCLVHDANADLDVDLHDAAEFQLAFTD